MPLQENVFAKKSFGLYKKTLKMSSLQSFENALQENFENAFTREL